MIELWLVVSTVCFSRVIDNWTLFELVRKDVCIQQIHFHDNPNTKKGEVAYHVVDKEKWLRALRYCGDNIKQSSSWQDAYEKISKENLGFIANDYSLGTYQKNYRELQTSTQVKILEKISEDNKNSVKIRQLADKLLWRFRIKIEENLINAE